jgi:hypothetical protein
MEYRWRKLLGNIQLEDGERQMRITLIWILEMYVMGMEVGGIASGLCIMADFDISSVEPRGSLPLKIQVPSYSED